MTKQEITKEKTNGFVNLYRSLLDWEYAGDDAVFSCFVKLLLAVNYKDNKWCGEVIKRGSIIGSMESLCAKLHIKRDKLKRCLNVLSACGVITVTVKPNKYHLIVVNNYNMYQNTVGAIPANCSANNSTNRTANSYANNPVNNTTNNPTTSKKRKKEKKVSVAPTGQTDTSKKNSPSPNAPESAFASAEKMEEYYDSIDWSGVSVAAKDEWGIMYGYLPPRPLRKFAKAHGIDDYIVGEFMGIHDRTDTPYPRAWQELLLKFSKAAPEQRDTYARQLIEKYRGKYEDE